MISPALSLATSRRSRNCEHVTGPVATSRVECRRASRPRSGRDRTCFRPRPVATGRACTRRSSRYVSARKGKRNFFKARSSPRTRRSRTHRANTDQRLFRGLQRLLAPLLGSSDHTRPRRSTTTPIRSTAGVGVSPHPTAPVDLLGAILSHVWRPTAEPSAPSRPSNPTTSSLWKTHCCASPAPCFATTPNGPSTSTGEIKLNRGVEEKTIVIRPTHVSVSPGLLAHKVFVALIKKHSDYGRPVQNEDLIHAPGNCVA